jgi:hypothetical protein
VRQEDPSRGCKHACRKPTIHDKIRGHLRTPDRAQIESRIAWASGLNRRTFHSPAGAVACPLDEDTRDNHVVALLQKVLCSNGVEPTTRDRRLDPRGALHTQGGFRRFAQVSARNHDPAPRPILSGLFAVCAVPAVSAGPPWRTIPLSIVQGAISTNATRSAFVATSQPSSRVALQCSGRKLMGRPMAHMSQQT